MCADGVGCPAQQSAEGAERGVDEVDGGEGVRYRFEGAAETGIRDMEPNRRTLRLLVQGGEGFEAGQTPVGLVVALPEEQRRIGVGGECSAGHRRGTGVNLTDVDGGEHVVFLLVIGCRHRAWDLRRSVRNLPIRGVIAIGNVRVRSHR